MKPKMHGMSDSREYYAWTNMKTRCYNPANVSYHRYGGRGIQVCARWLHDFSAFLADLGPCPDGMSLERKDNDGDYAPGNCRWATLVEQCNNRSSSILISHNGQTMTKAEWARGAGIAYDAFCWRLKVGMSMDRALLQGHLARLDPLPRRPPSRETRAKISAGLRSAALRRATA